MGVRQVGLLMLVGVAMLTAACGAASEGLGPTVADAAPSSEPTPTTAPATPTANPIVTPTSTLALTPTGAQIPTPTPEASPQAGETQPTPTPALVVATPTPTPIAPTPTLAGPTATPTPNPTPTIAPRYTNGDGGGFVVLDDPAFVPASQAGYIADGDLVLGYDGGAQARAYPVSMMWFHHIVNDTVLGDPLLVTY